jgi:hypothetical protein
MTPEHLQFTAQGEERLAEVRAFLDSLDEHEHPLAEAARREFEEKLSYLDTFGGDVSDEDARRRFRVVLGRDFAPLSFTIAWYRLDPATGEHVYAFNGGLIYHGGSNDPLAVTLTPCIFGIHT